MHYIKGVELNALRRNSETSLFYDQRAMIVSLYQDALGLMQADGILDESSGTILRQLSVWAPAGFQGPLQVC